VKEIILIKYDLLHLEILLLTIKTYLLNITFILTLLLQVHFVIQIARCIENKCKS